MRLTEIAKGAHVPFVVYVVGVSTDYYERYVLNASSEKEAEANVEQHIAGRHDNEREIVDVFTMQEFLHEYGPEYNVPTPRGDEIIEFDSGS